MKKIAAAGLTFMVFLTSAQAMEVTVYNQDLGLVKDTRSLNLQKGISDLRVEDVAARMDPTSVHFKSLLAPESVSVLEQNFEYDLISQEKLLEKYLGKEIDLERFTGPGGEKREVLHGTLLSNNGGQVIQSGGKIYVNPPGNPVLPELPEGLLIRPTLVWKLSAQKGGSQDCEISYLTSGMGWHSDYVLVTNAADDHMDLNSWVTLDNNSGATYKDAKLKLVAGDVNRVQAKKVFPVARAMAMAQTEASVSQFQEKSFFEYHLYTLSRPTTLRENETKQIELAQASNIPVKKLFIYDGVQGIAWGEYGDYYRTDPNYGIQGQKKVAVVLEFKNSKDNNLGIPLPSGRIRVYKDDGSGSLEFIGEDNIDHTPKDEKVRVRMGDAFDLVGERKRTNYQSDIRNRWFQESFSIVLRNHKDSDITVTVVEHLYRWTNWKISESSQKWEKKDAQTVEFQVPIGKNSETTVTYTVKYSW